METLSSGQNINFYFKHLLKYFRDGFQKIWTNIVEMEKLDVSFYQDIISVERNTNQAILTTWDSTTSKTIKHNCGFLIWSAPMTEFLRYMWVDNITTIFIYKSSFRVAGDNKCSTS